MDVRGDINYESESDTDQDLCERDNTIQNDDPVVCYDEKVDIWQLGTLVFELLTGRCPFEVRPYFQ